APGLEEGVGGGVTIARRHEAGAERRAERGLGLERVGIGLPYQLGRDLGAVEPRGDAVHDRRLQRVVMQEGRIDEGRELGLAARGLLGLAANARPDRVNLVERTSPRLMLSHDRLPHSYRGRLPQSTPS